MRHTEASSAKKANELLEKGWRIYKIQEKRSEIVFWIIKD